jgi:hypothetical protein
MKNFAQSVSFGVLAAASLIVWMAQAQSRAAAPLAISPTGIAPQPAVSMMAPNAVGGAPGAYGTATRFGNAPAGTPLGDLQIQSGGNPNYETSGPYLSPWNGVPSSISGYESNGFRGSQGGGLDIGGFRGYASPGTGYYGTNYGGYAPNNINNYSQPSFGTLGNGFQGFQNGAFEIGGFNRGIGTTPAR